MKRTLSVVLGAAMVFSLAACGGKGGDPSSETKAQNAEADTAIRLRPIRGLKQRSLPQIRLRSAWLTMWQNPIRPTKHL